MFRLESSCILPLKICGETKSIGICTHWDKLTPCKCIGFESEKEEAKKSLSVDLILYKEILANIAKKLRKKGQQRQTESRKYYDPIQFDIRNISADILMDISEIIETSLKEVKAFASLRNQ